MAVLVTGGAGFIGSHMVCLLADRGERVIVLDNLSTGFEWLIDPRAKHILGDAGDITLVTRVLAGNDVDAILHFAGSIIVPESVENPLKYYANNTATTRNLLEAAISAGVGNFIFSSTAAVYGMTGTGPVFEDAPLAPMAPYGRSKLMSEMMLADVALAHPLRFGVLRYFNVAGADPAGRTGQSTARATHLIKLACQTALGLRPRLEIFGTDYPTPDGTCLRDFIHVSDLVAAHALLLDHLRRGGASTTLNCGYGTGYSVRQVIEAVRAVSGNNFQVLERPRRPGDPAAVIAGADRIKAALGWIPQHDDLHEIVASALAWERKLGTLSERPEVA